jgi:hypothetical protein
MRFRVRRRTPHSSSVSGNAATLLAAAMLLMVGGIMIGVNMAGDQGSDYNERVKETWRRIHEIERAMNADKAKEGRLRRPAPSQYAMPNEMRPEEEGETNYFGVEAVISSDVNPANLPKVTMGPDIVTGKILRGDVPVVSLNIDPKLAFDAWGRRFVYMVQEDATIEADCRVLQEAAAKDPLLGLIKIQDASGGVKENVFYTITSLGRDGHLAVPMEGSTLENRINKGNTDADTLTNGVPNPLQLRDKVIQKPMTSTFDDIVYYSETRKRTCCLKKSCMATSEPQDGFRFEGIDTTDLAAWDMAIGDVNNDGIEDLVVGAPYARGGRGAVYVIFGKSSEPFPDTLPLSSLNGTNGFMVTCDGCELFGWSVDAGGDINGDGRRDIYIGRKVPHVQQMSCPAPNGAGAYVLFGKKTWPREVKFVERGGQWGPLGNTGFVFGGVGLLPNFSYDGVLGDLDGDNIADLSVSALGRVYVMSGYEGQFPIHPAYVDANKVGAGGSDGVPGFKVLPDANAGNDPTRPAPPSGTQNFAPSLAAGDFNNDGKGDLAIGAANVTPPAPNNVVKAGAVYVLFGSASNDGDINLGNLNGNNGYRIDGDIANGRLGSSVTAGDINGDGTVDIVAGAPRTGSLKLTYDSTGAVACCTTSPGRVYTVYGTPGVYPSSFMNVNTLNGTNGFVVSGSVVNDNFGAALATGDINGDGYTDIIAGAPTEGGSGEGAGYVVYGKSTFPSLMDVTSPDGTIVSRFHGSVPSQYVGWAVASGNLNVVNGDDVAFATPFSNFGGGVNSGGGYILFGPLSSPNIDSDDF